MESDGAVTKIGKSSAPFLERWIAIWWTAIRLWKYASSVNSRMTFCRPALPIRLQSWGPSYRRLTCCTKSSGLPGSKCRVKASPTPSTRTAPPRATASRPKSSAHAWFALVEVPSACHVRTPCLHLFRRSIPPSR